MNRRLVHPHLTCPPTNATCPGCLGTIKFERRTSWVVREGPFAGLTVKCSHCDRLWIFRKEGDKWIVQREVLYDMVKAGPNAEYRARRVGEELVKVIHNQRESRKKTKELYRRYLRDCKVLGIEPVPID